MELETQGADKAEFAGTNLVEALKAAMESESTLVRETACLTLTRLNVPDRCEDVMEGNMLTIEKVIFLKEIPFFAGMHTDQLRTLADISEEVSYGEGEQIFTEGEYGDALHVIVNGKVAIQRQETRRRRTSITRLAELGPGEYFAEMSIFDNEPYSAEAVAIAPTDLLLVRQAPLVGLIRRQPDLALGLLKVLSQRIRHANAIIAEKTRAQPKKMMDVYDKLGDTLG
jgi:CRP-like cAMP-binding protein